MPRTIPGEVERSRGLFWDTFASFVFALEIDGMNGNSSLLEMVTDEVN